MSSKSQDFYCSADARTVLPIRKSIPFLPGTRSAFLLQGRKSAASGYYQSAMKSGIEPSAAMKSNCARSFVRLCLLACKRQPRFWLNSAVVLIRLRRSIIRSPRFDPQSP